MNDARLTNLEIKFVHQDDFLGKLNQVVTEQQATIEKLQAQVLELQRQIGSIDGQRSMQDDKPPHF